MLTKALIEDLMLTTEHKYFRCRIFPITIRALSRLDLLGCTLLYSKYHALVHNLHRSISVLEVSDAFRTQQNSQKSSTENFLRVAAIDCDELAAELNVFEGSIACSRFTEINSSNHLNNLSRIMLRFLWMEHVRFLIRSTNLLVLLYASIYRWA